MVWSAITSAFFTSHTRHLDSLASAQTDFAQRFVLASFSGGCAALISCPVEVCLVRMSNDASLPVAERRGYSNVFSAISRIMTEEGPAAFYRGSQPFVIRAMVVGGTQVGKPRMRHICRWHLRCLHPAPS